ncbi:MAG: sensor histidine kinase [Alphaproteobacteria bacterium]|nr:sensor histidine kinase [Alphaproteobacteria bacterium]
MGLFEAEEETIAEAERLRERLADCDPALRQGVERLIEAYRRGFREQRRLVKVSDRLQAEVERRRAEAAEALTRLREAQDSLIQSEKLASLGALVAGVAHEVNTPVGIALSCASHLSDSTARLRASLAAGPIGRGEFDRYVEMAFDTSGLIVANCKRAAALVRGFKQVAADRASSGRRAFDLAALIEESLIVIAPRLRQSGHSVTVDCPPGIEIDSHPGALSQILVNLVVNALIHAWDEGEAGRISIAAALVDDGQSVRLVFADDGRGIPAQDRGRAFDPFFTTRRGRGGTGLGLHIVHNLATGPLGGSVRLDAGGAPGCAFTLIFPRVAPLIY